MRRRIGTLALVAVSVFVLAAPGWGNVGFDGGRTGNSPTETKITPVAARNLKVRWHVHLGRSTPPVADGGRVFPLASTAGGAELRAYSGANGGCSAPGVCTPLWTVTQPILTSILFTHGKVLAGGEEYVQFDGNPQDPFGFRYYGGGYDPASGAPLGGPRGSVTPGDTIAGGCLDEYVDGVTYHGTPYPYFTRSLNQVPLDSSCTFKSTDVTGLPVNGPLAADRGTVYALGSDRVTVLAASAWTAKLSSTTAVDALPSVARGRLFAPTLNGDVDVFPASGCGQFECTPSWIAKAGNVHIGAVAVTDTRLFVASDDGHLYAFRPAGCGAAVCAPTWTVNVGTGLHSPSVAGGVVYAGGQDGRVYAFDANGCGAKTCSPLGSAATGSPVRWAPVISAGRVYVTNDAGDLYALGAG